MQLICDSELLLTRNVCRLRAVMPTQTHPEHLAPLTPQICARAAPYHPRFASHRLHPRHTFLSFSRSPQLAAPTDHRRLRSRYKRSDHQRARGSAYHITRARSSTVNVSARTGLQNRTETAAVTISEVLSGIITFLYAFSLALLLPRAAVPGAGARPPRRAALALLPLVPRTHTTPPPFEISSRASTHGRPTNAMRRAVRRSG